MQQLTALSELETNDTVQLKGNGLDVEGTVEDIEPSEFDDREIAYVRDGERVLTVKEPKSHPLQTDNGLFQIGGLPPAKAYRL